VDYPNEDWNEGSCAQHLSQRLFAYARGLGKIGGWPKGRGTFLQPGRAVKNKKKGIVNHRIAASLSFKAAFWWPAYTASKHGIDGNHKCAWANEWGARETNSTPMTVRTRLTCT